jgi:hypothetical protein
MMSRSASKALRGTGRPHFIEVEPERSPAFAAGYSASRVTVMRVAVTHGE